MKLTMYQRRALLRVRASDKIRAANQAAWQNRRKAVGLTSEETRAMRGANPPRDVWYQCHMAGYVELAPVNGYTLTDAGRAALEQRS